MSGPIIDKTEFFSRFSQSELEAYYSAIDANSAPIRALRDMFLMAPYDMELEHPALVQAKALLVAAGILTQTRANEVFS